MGCKKLCGSFHITPEPGQGLIPIVTHCSGPGPCYSVLSLSLSVFLPLCVIYLCRQEVIQTTGEHGNGSIRFYGQKCFTLSAASLP